MISSRGFIRLPLAGMSTSAPFVCIPELTSMNRKKLLCQFLVILTLLVGSAEPAVSETIIFDLRAPFMGTNDGNILEETGTYTEGGITVTATAENGVVNGTGDGMGVNADEVGDDTDEIEAEYEESLSLTFNFSGISVQLVSIDLAGVGAVMTPAEEDSALISINDVLAVELFTGVTGPNGESIFNGSQDIWTPAETLNLISGDVFTFTATDSYRIEEITVETSVVSTNDNADFDSDTFVDGSDFTIWQRGFGTGTTFTTGDANNSGSIDAEDLTVWRGQYGNTVGSIVAVPEPATASFALLMLFSCVAASRRQG